ncbi:helix-turn-helix transcriptional regulator [Streptacidiphilus sp. N1-10]|uniref:Helix-turn-helix transcriptional regulator n=2 Tax=Streptacidiphilus jeojiensis TaxID=3229225 RepID=A0ABV6XXU2_9ACTN
MGDQQGGRVGSAGIASVLRYLLAEVHPEDRAPYTMAEVATGAGVSESTLKAIKTGRGNPTFATLESLAEFFQVPAEVWVNPADPAAVIAGHRLEQAKVAAGVVSIALRADGLDAEGMDYVRRSIDQARRAQGLGPAKTGLDLRN